MGVVGGGVLLLSFWRVAFVWVVVWWVGGGCWTGGLRGFLGGVLVSAGVLWLLGKGLSRVPYLAFRLCRGVWSLVVRSRGTGFLW